MSDGSAAQESGGAGAEPEPRKDEQPQRSLLATYLKYSHVGVQFFLAVALFTGGGIWLDKRCGTKVLFTLLGLVLGFSGGLLSIYRELGPGGRSRPSTKHPTKPGPNP